MSHINKEFKSAYQRISIKKKKVKFLLKNVKILNFIVIASLLR